MRHRHIRKSLAACGITAMLLLGTSASPAVAADRPDSWVTMKTQIALLTAEGVDTSDLNVDTVEGVVTLHGKVASDDAKAKAAEVARSIDGVKEVRNLLQVVPESRREAVSDNDDAIKDRIEQAFDQNEALKDSGIVVASVNNGVVLLSGKTDNLKLHLDAIKAANAVKGVRRVASEVYVDSATAE